MTNDQCRNCEHFWDDHSHCSPKICCYGEINTLGYVELTCHCKEYIPGDNLEFLEWKYGRKLDKKFSN